MLLVVIVLACMIVKVPEANGNEQVSTSTSTCVPTLPSVWDRSSTTDTTETSSTTTSTNVSTPSTTTGWSEKTLFGGTSLKSLYNASLFASPVADPLVFNNVENNAMKHVKFTTYFKFEMPWIPSFPQIVSEVESTTKTKSTDDSFGYLALLDKFYDPVNSVTDYSRKVLQHPIPFHQLSSPIPVLVPSAPVFSASVPVPEVSPGSLISLGPPIFDPYYLQSTPPQPLSDIEFMTLHAEPVLIGSPQPVLSPEFVVSSPEFSFTPFQPITPYPRNFPTVSQEPLAVSQEPMFYVPSSNFLPAEVIFGPRFTQSTTSNSFMNMLPRPSESVLKRPNSKPDRPFPGFSPPPKIYGASHSLVIYSPSLLKYSHSSSHSPASHYSPLSPQNNVTNKSSTKSSSQARFTHKPSGNINAQPAPSVAGKDALQQQGIQNYQQPENVLKPQSPVPNSSSFPLQQENYSDKPPGIPPPQPKTPFQQGDHAYKHTNYLLQTRSSIQNEFTLPSSTETSTRTQSSVSSTEPPGDFPNYSQPLTVHTAGLPTPQKSNEFQQFFHHQDLQNTYFTTVVPQFVSLSHNFSPFPAEGNVIDKVQPTQSGIHSVYQAWRNVASFPPKVESTVSQTFPREQVSYDVQESRCSQPSMQDAPFQKNTASHEGADLLQKNVPCFNGLNCKHCCHETIPHQVTDQKPQKVAHWYDLTPEEQQQLQRVSAERYKKLHTNSSNTQLHNHTQNSGHKKQLLCKCASVVKPHRPSSPDKLINSNACLNQVPRVHYPVNYHQVEENQPRHSNERVVSQKVLSRKRPYQPGLKQRGELRVFQPVHVYTHHTHQPSKYQHRPEQHRPEQHRPEQHRPEQHRPEQHRPEQHRPEQHRPEQHRPEQYRPEQHRPEQHRPEQHRPEQHRPEQHRPEQHRPEQHRPEQQHISASPGVHKFPQKQSYIKSDNHGSKTILHKKHFPVVSMIHWSPKISVISEITGEPSDHFNARVRIHQPQQNYRKNVLPAGSHVNRKYNYHSSSGAPVVNYSNHPRKSSQNIPKVLKTVYNKQATYRKPKGQPSQLVGRKNSSYQKNMTPLSGNGHHHFHSSKKYGAPRQEIPQATLNFSYPQEHEINNNNTFNGTILSATIPIFADSLTDIRIISCTQNSDTDDSQENISQSYQSTHNVCNYQKLKNSDSKHSQENAEKDLSYQNNPGDNHTENSGSVDEIQQSQMSDSIESQENTDTDDYQSSENFFSPLTKLTHSPISSTSESKDNTEQDETDKNDPDGSHKLDFLDEIDQDHDFDSNDSQNNTSSNTESTEILDYLGEVHQYGNPDSSNSKDNTIPNARKDYQGTERSKDYQSSRNSESAQEILQSQSADSDEYQENTEQQETNQSDSTDSQGSENFDSEMQPSQQHIPTSNNSPKDINQEATQKNALDDYQSKGKYDYREKQTIRTNFSFKNYSQEHNTDEVSEDLPEFPQVTSSEGNNNDVTQIFDPHDLPEDYDSTTKRKLTTTLHDNMHSQEHGREEEQPNYTPPETHNSQSQSDDYHSPEMYDMPEGPEGKEPTVILEFNNQPPRHGLNITQKPVTEMPRHNHESYQHTPYSINYRLKNVHIPLHHHMDLPKNNLFGNQQTEDHFYFSHDPLNKTNDTFPIEHTAWDETGPRSDKVTNLDKSFTRVVTYNYDPLKDLPTRKEADFNFSQPLKPLYKELIDPFSKHSKSFPSWQAINLHLMPQKWIHYFKGRLLPTSTVNTFTNNAIFEELELQTGFVPSSQPVTDPTEDETDNNNETTNAKILESPMSKGKEGHEESKNNDENHLTIHISHEYHFTPVFHTLSINGVKEEPPSTYVAPSNKSAALHHRQQLIHPVHTVATYSPDYEPEPEPDEDDYFYDTEAESTTSKPNKTSTSTTTSTKKYFTPEAIATATHSHTPELDFKDLVSIVVKKSTSKTRDDIDQVLQMFYETSTVKHRPLPPPPPPVFHRPESPAYSYRGHRYWPHLHNRRPLTFHLHPNHHQPELRHLYNNRYT